MSINMNGYVNVFIEESIEYIKQLDMLVVNLENNKSDKETLKKIYHIMHTLKGISGIIGFNEFSTIMHTVDNFFIKLFEKKLKVINKIVESLYHIIDVLKVIITEFQKGKEISLDFDAGAGRFKSFIKSQMGNKRCKEEEIDKKMINLLLFEPLLYLVRNTVDHYIETPEKHLIQSKNEEAVPQLRSYNKQKPLFIEVPNDSRVIDKERIREHSVSNGILSEETEINKEEILNMIMENNV
jgi:chemotaxis protein histidine kinase CheA